MLFKTLILNQIQFQFQPFENGTQQWIQKPTGTHQQKHVIALRWCRDSIHYDWLKLINSDEPKRVTPLPVLRPGSRDRPFPHTPN